VFVGQLFRYYHICNTVEAFVRHAADLHLFLTGSNGFHPGTLLHKFRLFVRQNVSKFRVKHTKIVKSFETALDSSQNPGETSPTDGPEDNPARRSSSSSSRQRSEPTRKGDRQTIDIFKGKSTPRRSARLKPKDNPVILDSSNPTHWLSEVMIANILHELHLKYIHRPHVSVPIDYIYPMTMKLLSELIGNDSPSSQVRQIKDSNGLAVTSLNIGSHWTALVIDARPEREEIFYFDSLGKPIPPRLTAAIDSTFPSFSFFDCEMTVQFEGVHCGVWACWYLECVLSCLRDNVPLTSSMGMSSSVSINPLNSRLKSQNTLIVAKRNEYALWLEEAVQDNALLYVSG